MTSSLGPTLLARELSVRLQVGGKQAEAMHAAACAHGDAAPILQRISSSSKDASPAG
jgi:hypothetical protein